MDNLEKLTGLVKEQIESSVSKDIEEIKAEAEVQKEANAKILEENTELKAKFDAMQDKVVAMATKNAGTQRYVFKGYNPELSKNFKSTITTSEADEVAKAIADKLKSGISGPIFDKTYDGSNAVPAGYGNAVMGLAELSSVALTHANVISIDAPVLYMPTKGTREAVDAQVPGTANAVGQQTVGQLTFTIDKRIGTYLDLLNTNIDDANFDIVNQLIVPLQAEAIGQHLDAEMFNGTEFTSSISGATASVTTSGTVATAAALTFANLATMYYALEWERGIMDPKWFGSRAALKDIASILDGDSRPIFMQIPINNRPSQTLMGAQYVVTPSVADVPANGSIRLAFGDARHYTIVLRGGAFTSLVNPYILMKEDKTQFIMKCRADGNISDHATASSSGAWTTLIRTDA